jgi:glycosyltransferase involved in cell wall biosynthesis
MLMPSLSENQPLALLEAIAAEVPVVASDIPAHRELVGLGCLPAAALAPLTAEGFAEAITRVQQMQSWEQYASKINELFSQDGFSAELCAFFRSQSH